ncbi:MAG: hypothetical protein U5O15_04505 [Candidatus Krumholzibacteriota bacterium]|nr:hypothetical protein [Candidatus Krumholzibacteriota bacterium]
MKKRIFLVSAVMLFIVFSVSGCLDDVKIANPDDISEENIEAPQGVAIKVDNGEIALSWEAVDNAGHYKIFRKTQLTEERVVAEPTNEVYVDDNLLNGNEYYYSIAGVGSSGLEGSRSSWIRGVPSVYSILINNGTVYTNSVDVNIQVTAPEICSVMKIANDSTLAGVSWERCVESKNWTVEHVDGEKLVYAVFQDAFGNESYPVSASVILDTYSRIISVSITPDSSFYDIGQMIHFSMNVEDNEAGGEAGILIEGYSDTVELYDNNRFGDGVAEDGIYERDFYPPSSLTGTDLIVNGIFIDKAGNAAPAFELEKRISFTE